MKKLIFASAAVLFVGVTAFAAFTQGENKSTKKCNVQCEQNTCTKYFTFNNWSEYTADVKPATADDTAKAKAAEAKKEKLIKSQIISKPKMYFMIPMADSMPVDTANGGGC